MSSACNTSSRIWDLGALRGGVIRESGLLSVFEVVLVPTPRLPTAPLSFQVGWGGPNPVLVMPNLLDSDEHRCSFSQLLHSQGRAHG